MLLIHGTSSSTGGSFEGLKGSEPWKALCRAYGNNILAYEHRTWSKSPLENAVDILTGLPRDAKIHLLSHSRGGIIGDILCRCSRENSLFTHEEIAGLESEGRKEDAASLRQLNKLAADKNPSVEQFTRVACPAAGTTLLSQRLDHYLNFVLNTLGYAAGPQGKAIVKALQSFLASVAAQRFRPDVLPGLEAMTPESPIQRIINNHQVRVEGSLHIISGNAGPQSVRKTLLYIMTRLYYRKDNDFVVDTDSMYMGALREKVYYKYVSGRDVDHFSYFRNADTQQAVFTALRAEKNGLPPGFKEARPDVKNRNVALAPPGGSVFPEAASGKKPIVILLPGIMGSNLYENSKEIWLNYLMIATGWNTPHPGRSYWMTEISAVSFWARPGRVPTSSPKPSRA